MSEGRPVWCCANAREFIPGILDNVPGCASFRTLKPDGDGTGTVEDRNIARHVAEDDDARLGNTAAAIVDHEVIGTPEAECSGRKIPLPHVRRQGGGQIAGLFLTEMIRHVD